MLLYPLRVYPDFLRLLVPPGDFPRFPRNALVPQRMEGSSPPPHSLRHARSPTLTLITRDGGGGDPACPRLLHRRLVPLLRIPAALFPDVWWAPPFPVPTTRAEPHPHSTPALNYVRPRFFPDVWWAPLLHPWHFGMRGAILTLTTRGGGGGGFARPRFFLDVFWAPLLHSYASTARAEPHPHTHHPYCWRRGPRPPSPFPDVWWALHFPPLLRHTEPHPQSSPVL